MTAELLLSMSGIAISLTGFTGVVSVLGQRSERTSSAFDVFLREALLQWSLIAAFAGLLPGVLGALEHPPPNLWRICLLLVFSVHAVSALWTLAHIRGMDFGAMTAHESAVVITGFPIGVGVLGAQFAVLAGVLPEVRFAYTASVAYFLVLSALAFSFSLFSGMRQR